MTKFLSTSLIHSIIIISFLILRVNSYEEKDTDTYHLDEIEVANQNARHGQAQAPRVDDLVRGPLFLSGHQSHVKVKIFCYYCKDAGKCQEFKEASKRKKNKVMTKQCVGEDVDRCVIIRNKNKEVTERRCLDTFVERHIFNSIGCKKYKETSELCTCYGDLCNGVSKRSPRGVTLTSLLWVVGVVSHLVIGV